MKNLMMSIIVCLSMLVMSSLASAEAIRFHACSPKYPDLCATNVANMPIHLLVTMESIGCNGVKTPQPGAYYKLIDGEDFTADKIRASYLWKVSHYDYFYLMPGQTTLVQSAPYCNGNINYSTLDRGFTFSPEQWDHFKAQVHKVNPFCDWAKPEEKK